MASKTQRKNLYLVDGTSQLFRAYFAIRGLTSDDGLPTNAVFGFTTMLRKLLADEPVDLLAVAFDPGGKVFRHETFADYKANRPSAPEDLRIQVPYAREVCEAYGATVIVRDGFEADDLIATYARQGREAGLNVVVVASDKDLLQLVREGVEVLNPSRNQRLDRGGVEASFGVPPERVLDVQGLMGDSVDNIPGVPGVGGKTAMEIVSRYGDLESAIARAGRFAQLLASRDRVLEEILTLEKADEVSNRAAETFRDAWTAFSTSARELAETDPESEWLDALREILGDLDAFDPSSLEPGGKTAAKQAAKTLRPLKKSLKAIDRGSGKRAWLAIDEFAEQARLSRTLATLKDDVPVDAGPETFVLRERDGERLRTLFRSLGFRTLVKDLEAEEAAPSKRSTAGEDDDSATEGAASGPLGDYEAVFAGKALESVVEQAREAGTIAVDTETDGVDPMRANLVGVSLSWREGHGVYVPVAHAYEDAPAQLPIEELRRILGPLLADPTVAKIGQNLKYDAHVLRRHGMPVEGWTMDTMVAAFLLNPGRAGFSMDSLSEEYLGHTPISYASLAGTGAKQVTLDQVEIERVAPYAAEDADVTLRLAACLKPRLREAELLDLYNSIDGPLLPLLVRMEAHGIRVEAGMLGKMGEELERSVSEIREKVIELAGVEFNLDSPKQLREVLFENLGLKSRRKTAKGQVLSTDARALEELAADHEIAGKLLEYRELTKLKGTYVDALPKLIHPETGRVHTSYHPTGAATGRLSSSDPNLQNIPARNPAGRAIRAAFVPDPGCVFLASDYSQIELRVLAHLAEDDELISAFQAGEDIHRYTAARVFGVSTEEVTSTMRTRAKAVNFGILYGMSETRLAREQGMQRSEARAFIASYFERFSKVGAYIEEVRERALRDAAVRTLFGRVRLFPQLHGRPHRGIQEQAYRAAVNTTIQGTAADLMKLAMLRVDDTLREAGLAARMLLQVHDELLLEVPEAELEATVEAVREAMEGVYPLRVPLSVDQKTGSSWLEVT